MKTTRLGNLDKDVSLVVQGAMGLLNLDDAGAFACLDAAVDAGICALDTAHIYAYGERSVDALLGSWIQERKNRDQVVLLSKGCHPEPPDWEAARVEGQFVAADVEDSLVRMGLEHLDVWSFHRDNPAISMEELVQAANAEIKRGTIGAWGVSNWTSDRIQQAMDVARANNLAGPVCNSAHYSLVDQVQPPWDDVVTLTGDAGSVDLQWHLHNTQLPVIAWSALSGGVLSSNLSREDFAAAEEGHLAEVFASYNSETNWERRTRAEEIAATLGVSLSDVAIAWLLNAKLAPLAIVGGATPEEIHQNAAAAQVQLTAEQHSYIFGETS